MSIEAQEALPLERLQVAIALEVERRSAKDLCSIAEHIVDMACEPNPRALSALLFIMTYQLMSEIDVSEFKQILAQQKRGAF
jgi:hypothetical protein